MVINIADTTKKKIIDIFRSLSEEDKYILNGKAAELKVAKRRRELYEGL